MANIFAVLGGDSRQRYIAEGLARLGHEVRTFAVPGRPDTHNSLAETVASAAFVILPMPALDGSGNIRNSRNLALSPAQAAAGMGPGTVVFAGKPGSSRDILEQRARVVDYSSWETLAIANAVPTAEGALQLAMQHTPCTLQGSRMLVTGAGRIGMCLARKLQALGVSVTVTARKDADFAAIRAAGLQADLTGCYNLGLDRYDCIFNTVPAPVFSGEHAKKIRPDCVLIELASSPGGFPDGVNAVSGAALPGKVAPKTAGEIILTEILTFIQKESS